MVRMRLPDEEYMLLGRKAKRVDPVVGYVVVVQLPRRRRPEGDFGTVFPRSYCPRRIGINGLWTAMMEAFSKKRNEDNSDPPPPCRIIPSIH
jgi:hypothetical protein